MSFKDSLRNVKNTWVYKYVEKARDISERAYSIADEKGITSADLARKLNVSTSAIAQCLNPEANLTVKTIVKLAGALGTTADALFSGERAHNLMLNIEVYILPETEQNSRLKISKSVPDDGVIPVGLAGNSVSRYEMAA